MAILVIAQGGAAAYAPEQTLAAFDLAAKQSADLLGVTLHLSGDGHPVVIQDERLERTTNGQGYVNEWTLRELKRLDAGSWFSAAFSGQRLQTLTEVIERFKDEVGFWIELPAGSERYPGIEERMISLLQIYGVDDRALICSASLTALSKLRDLDPSLKTVFSCAGRQAELGALGHIGVSGVFLARDVSEGTMTLAAEKGLKLYVRTDERQAMARLVRRGVAGLVTPRPDLLRSLLPPS